MQQEHSRQRNSIKGYVFTLTIAEKRWISCLSECSLTSSHYELSNDGYCGNKETHGHGHNVHILEAAGEFEVLSMEGKADLPEEHCHVTEPPDCKLKNNVVQHKSCSMEGGSNWRQEVNESAERLHHTGIIGNGDTSPQTYINFTLRGQHSAELSESVTESE